MTAGRRVRRLSTYVEDLVALVAIFVLVAAVVEAVSEDSWGPVWTIAWVPAVLLASLFTGPTSRSCRPLPRGRTRSQGRPFAG